MILDTSMGQTMITNKHGYPTGRAGELPDVVMVWYGELQLSICGANQPAA